MASNKTIQQLMDDVTISLVQTARRNTNHKLDNWLLHLTEIFDLGQCDRLFQESRRSSMKRILVHQLRQKNLIAPQKDLNEAVTENIFQELTWLLRCNINIRNEEGRKDHYYFDLEEHDTPTLKIDRLELEEERKNLKLLAGKPPKKTRVSPENSILERTEAPLDLRTNIGPGTLRNMQQATNLSAVTPSTSDIRTTDNFLPWMGAQNCNTLNTPDILNTDDNDWISDTMSVDTQKNEVQSGPAAITFSTKDFNLPDLMLPEFMPADINFPEKEKIDRVLKLVRIMWAFVNLCNYSIGEKDCNMGCPIHCLAKLKLPKGRKTAEEEGRELQAKTKKLK